MQQLLCEFRFGPLSSSWLWLISQGVNLQYIIWDVINEVGLILLVLFLFLFFFSFSCSFFHLFPPPPPFFLVIPFLLFSYSPLSLSSFCCSVSFLPLLLLRLLTFELMMRVDRRGHNLSWLTVQNPLAVYSITVFTDRLSVVQQIVPAYSTSIGYTIYTVGLSLTILLPNLRTWTCFSRTASIFSCSTYYLRCQEFL